MPVNLQCFAAMDGSKSLNDHGWAFKTYTSLLKTLKSGRLRFSYFRTTGQNRPGFMQNDSQKFKTPFAFIPNIITLKILRRLKGIGL